ncbi:MAG: polyhydroxyalkanoate synthesis regulator DNA-binding domain-containing protein [Terriglobales bacterium]|jgi:polyhydroxyalkanoate synthesis repressor PhaR
MVQGNSEPSKVVFKKYGKNRRLYDTAAKRYVTLDALAVAVRRGAEVQVIDAETGEDLTPVCLTQIIMDDARDKPAGLPLELLRQLIVASDHVGREFIMWYLKSAFDTYHKVQNALESGLSEVQSAARSPLQLVKDLIQSKVAEKPPVQNELQELRKRIAELEERPVHAGKKQDAKKSKGAGTRKLQKPARRAKSKVSPVAV